MGVQSNCPKGTEVTGAHVLMFVYHEKGHAVESLHKEGLTRADVKTFADKKAEVPGSYTDSRRPSLLEALQLKGGTMEEAYASLEQKGYFTPPPRPWRLGFQDRGMGRRDYAVLDKFGDPVVQAPNRIVAEFIIKAVNNYQE